MTLLSKVVFLGLSVAAYAQTFDPCTDVPPGYVRWVPGRTKVDNGAGVVYECQCYTAKNCPGVWETPDEPLNTHFWEHADCDVKPQPDLNSCTSPPVSTLPPAKPDPTQGVEGCDNDIAVGYLAWSELYGHIQVENGQGVHHNCRCYIARNCPGPWENPRPGYHWRLTDCMYSPEPPIPRSCTSRTTTEAVTTTMPPGACYRPPMYIPWIAGQTKVDNGVGVFYNCRCYEQIRCAGRWEAPTNTWFWRQLGCAEAPEPIVGSCVPTEGPTSSTPAPPTTAPAPTNPPVDPCVDLPNGYVRWVAGQTKVDNGAGVVHDCKCYTAQNCPGRWDAPGNPWFWNSVECSFIPQPDLYSCTDAPVTTSAPAPTSPTQEVADCSNPIAVGYLAWSELYGNTQVDNGQGVHRNCYCYTAQNCPGPWENPRPGHHWVLQDCAYSPDAPDVGSCQFRRTLLRGAGKR